MFQPFFYIPNNTNAVLFGYNLTFNRTKLHK